MATAAELLTSQFRRNEEAARYILRSNDYFVRPRAANEDHRAFLRKHLLWQLERLSARTTGLPKDSVANISQPLTLDKELLTKRAGRLPSAKLELLFFGIDLVLSR